MSRDQFFFGDTIQKMFHFIGQGKLITNVPKDHDDIENVQFIHKIKNWDRALGLS